MGWFGVKEVGCGELDYAACEKWYRHQYKMKRQNVEIHKLGDDYHVQWHHNTIIENHKDGTVVINTCGWQSSAGTRIRINELAPYIKIWTLYKDRDRYENKVRFGSYWGENDSRGYPWPGKLVVPPDRKIRGLVDKKYVAVPMGKEQKRKRRELAAELRVAAWPRLLLGEFNNHIVEQSFGGWVYRVGDVASAEQVVKLFLGHASEDKIAKVLDTRFNSFAQRQCWGRNRGVFYYTSRPAALRAFLNYLLRLTILLPNRERTTVNVEYSPVVV